MNTFAIFTVTLTLFAAPALHAATRAGANGPLRMIEAQLAKSVPPLKTVDRKIKGQDCVDFTGNWEGTCRESTGRQSEESLLIEQNDCQAIVIGLEILRFTGFQSTVESEVDPVLFGGTSTSHTRWDDSGKFITRRRSLDYSVQDANFFVKANVKEKYWIQNATLISSTKMDFTIDRPSGIEQISTTTECTYTKKN